MANKNKLLFTESEWIALTDKYSDPELAKKLNVHKNAILYWRTKLKIPPKHKYKRHKTYQVNEDFFSDIRTEAQAYTLGFFAGDGNVHPNKRSISISISIKDKEILEKIRTSMSGNMPIHTVPNNRGFNPNGISVVLDLCRKKFVTDLAKLGIKPNKTFGLKYPVIPEELDRHFIRGVWDADGWVGKEAMGLCGAALFIQAVRNKIKKHTDINLAAEANIIFKIYGYKPKKPVLDWFYKEATIFLERKYLNYLKYWQ